MLSIVTFQTSQLSRTQWYVWDSNSQHQCLHASYAVIELRRAVGDPGP